MALPLSPFLPFALRFGVRAVLLGGVGWLAGRMVTEQGDPDKALKAMRADVGKAYAFFTHSQTSRLKDAGEALEKKGGNLATFATALMALVEFVGGIKLTKTTEVFEKAKTVLDAFKKLTPAEQAEAERTARVDINSVINEALAKEMHAIGMQRLYDETGVDAMTLSQYLNLKYTGLFYIGRSGNQLTPKEVDALASKMVHLHTMIKGRGKKKQQGPMIAWYQSKGVGFSADDTMARLTVCPEVNVIGKDAERYIAYALRQSVPDLKFDGIAAEMSVRVK